MQRKPIYKDIRIRKAKYMRNQESNKVPLNRLLVATNTMHHIIQEQSRDTLIKKKRYIDKVTTAKHTFGTQKKQTIKISSIRSINT